MSPLVALALGAVLTLVQQAGPAGSEDPLAASLRRLGLESVEDAPSALGRAPNAADARALSVLAQHLDRVGNARAAEPLLRDALRMRTELYGLTDRRSLYLVQLLMMVLGRSGRPADAIHLGEEVLEAVDGAPEVDPATLLVVLNNHAVNLQMVGALGAAEECSRRSLDLVESTKGPESSEFATGVTNLALVLTDSGRVREARELAAEALELRLDLFPGDTRAIAFSHAALGRILRQLGELAAAETHMRRAEALLRSTGPIDRRMLADALDILGGLALSRGDPADAEALLREALALRAAAQGKDHPDLVSTRTALAVALMLQGEATQAHELFEQAVTLGRATWGPLHRWTLQARTGAALARRDLGDVPAAIETLRGVLEDLEATPSLTPEIAASVHSNLARCLAEEGELAAAHGHLDRATGLIERQFGPASMFLVEPYTQRASLHETAGELELAEAQARLALEIATQERNNVLGAELERSLLSGQLAHAELGRTVARLCLARGDLPSALDALEEVRARTLLDGLLRAGRDAPQDSAALEPLLQREEDARADLRELEARAAALGPRDGAAREAAASAVSSARNRLGSATAALGRLASAAAEEARPSSLPEIRARLGPGEVLLTFTWSARQVAWIRVQPEGTEPALSSGVLADGREAVRELEHRIAALARGLSLDPRRRADPLPEPDSLVPGAAELLPAGTRHVHVVPDGPLTSVPFELLLPAEGELPRSIVSLPSASTLVALAERGERARASGPDPAVVLGDPSFGTDGVAQARSGRALARLPATRVEAEYAAALLDAAGREVRLLTGEDATRTALEEACEHVGLVHLATHGFPGSARSPFDAAVALAAEGEAPRRGSSDALTLDRLMRRWGGRLEGCELVVLSACETNRAVEVGSGVYSLATGFFHAGARSVLASLWRVDEQATALLMGRLFENLTGHRLERDDQGVEAVETGEPMDTASALREAQAWLRSASRDEVRAATRRMGLARSEDRTRSPESRSAAAPATSELRPYADPYFWSGFVLIGRAPRAD